MDTWLLPLRGFGAVRTPRGSGFVWDSGWSSGVDIDFGNGIGICNQPYPVLSVVRRAQQIFKVGTSVRVQLRTGTAGSGGNVFFFFCFCFFNGLGSSLGGKHS
jgi:hypothetical protein